MRPRLPLASAQLLPSVLVAVTALAGMATAPTSGQDTPSPARIVADLVVDETNLGSAPFPIAEVGGEVLVAADDGIHGIEPWLVDSTSGDARLLADICPGRCSSIDQFELQFAVTEDDRVFFLANDGQSNPDSFWRSSVTLWVSDLTTQGTRVVSDLPVLIIDELTTLGDRVVFTGQAVDGGGQEPWISDGTDEGTHRIADVNPIRNSYPRGYQAVGDTLFFSATTDDHGREWWRWSEGSPPEMVVDLCPGTCDGVYYDLGFPRFFELGRAGDRWLFLGYSAPSNGPGTGTSLFGTDGTAAGTQLLMDGLDPVFAVFGHLFFESGGRVYFSKDRELWQSDGTLAGTSQAGDLPQAVPYAITALSSGASPPLLIQMASQLLLFRIGEGFEVVADAGFSNFADAGDHVVFRGLDEFFSFSKDTFTLATLAGFELPETASHNPFLTLTQNVVFRAEDTAGGELWISDGTGSGTRRLVDIRPSRADSNPRELTSLGDRLVFTADTRTDAVWPETPAELWSTRGVGAKRLLDGGSPKDLTSVGDLVFFQVYEEGRGYEPWISDGTAAGTRSLGDLNPGPDSSYAREPVLLNGKIYFFADASLGTNLKGGQKLWVSDGTAQGTRIVVDILPDYQSCHPGLCAGAEVLPRDLTVVGDRLAFVGGRNLCCDRTLLWSSDGSAAGTVSVLSSDDGAEFNEPESLLYTNDRLFFAADDASGFFYLWATDADFNPPVRLALYNYYQATPTPGLGSWFSFVLYSQMMTSDGTAEGTHLVEIPYGLTYPRIAVGDDIFFSSADSNGDAGIGGELWATDGSEAGTRLIADLRPGLETSGLQDFVTDGEYLYFTADDGEFGHEIWRTDGDTVERLTDLAPGPATATPSDLTLVGSQLYFTADSSLGRELWAMPKSGQAGCTSDATHHCLAGERFRVSTRWRVPATGAEGAGRVVDAEGAGTDDTGYFYFFGAENVEFAVKVLDGTPINNHHWVFSGALTDVEVWLDVYDTWTGLEKSWHRPPGDLCGFADVGAFPEPPQATGGSLRAPSPDPAPATVEPAANMMGACEADTTTLCLHERFAVRVRWRQNGQLFQAQAVPFTDETGQFWFFGQENVEVILKVLDGRPLNDHWWVFHGVLTNLPLEIEVTDTASGQTWVESTAGGDLCGGADTRAIPD